MPKAVQWPDNDAKHPTTASNGTPGLPCANRKADLQMKLAPSVQRLELKALLGNASETEGGSTFRSRPFLAERDSGGG